MPCPLRILTLALLATACGDARPPHVVLVTIESLRTDHVSAHAGPRPTTPGLDRLASEGVVYTDAHSVTSWTLSSHASLFTGLYPSAHQTVSPLGRLDDSYTTLAEVLRDAGYQCAGVVSGPFLRRAHNLHQGFEFYDDSPAAETHPEAHHQVTSPRMTEGLRRFLEEERDPARPLFLFAYFWDPHYDYIPPAPHDAAFVEPGMQPVDLRMYEGRDVVNPRTPPAQLAWVEAQYDGEILWTDGHVGALFDALRAADLWDRALVIVTSDHGEEFFDHGQKGHKNNLYAETVHVPLVVKYPGGHERGRDDRLASLVDVLPTVLEVTGARTDAPLQGRSLLGPPPLERTIFHELHSTWYVVRPQQAPEKIEQRWAAVRRGDFKLIAVPDEGRVELYDVSADPRERVDLSASRAERVATLTRVLAGYRSSARELAAAHPADAPEADLDPEMVERLRALGYLQ